MACCGKRRKEFKDSVSKAKSSTASRLKAPPSKKITKPISVSRSQRIKNRQERIKQRNTRIANRKLRVEARAKKKLSIKT